MCCWSFARNSRGENDTDRSPSSSCLVIVTVVSNPLFSSLRELSATGDFLRYRARNRRCSWLLNASPAKTEKPECPQVDMLSIVSLVMSPFSCKAWNMYC